MKKILGQENIFVPSEFLLEYPSPEELKRKFIIKGKKPPPDENQVKLTYLKSVDEEEKEGKKKKKAVKKVHTVKVHPQLIELVGMDGAKFDIDADRSPSLICSVTSNKISKIAKEKTAVSLINYHKKYFTRVYPHALKIDSSNFNPIKPWMFGAQVVALNMQTKDLPMLINYAWFQDNGGPSCGYVLKPQDMYDSQGPEFDPISSMISVPQFILEVEVISAQKIPKPNREGKGEIIDPFVELQVHGIDQDDTKVMTTKVVDNNGFNPIWKETFKFEIRKPELAVLTFQVLDHDVVGKNTKICQYAITMNMIRTGIRVVHMLDTNLDPLPHTCLLCRFKKLPPS